MSVRVRMGEAVCVMYRYPPMAALVAARLSKNEPWATSTAVTVGVSVGVAGGAVMLGVDVLVGDNVGGLVGLGVAVTKYIPVLAA